jgi:hypothetical protein
MTENNQSSQGKTRAEIEAEIVAKAWQDETFKQDLLSNPRAVFEKEIGNSMPEDLQISVVEETPQHIYINIPVKPVIENSEQLSDEALEAVAGGWNALYKDGGWIVNG